MTVDLKIENNIAEKVPVTESGRVRLVCKNMLTPDHKVEELAYSYSGKLEDRYQCYLAYTTDLYPKTFDEWLGSY